MNRKEELAELVEAIKKSVRLYERHFGSDSVLDDLYYAQDSIEGRVNREKE